MKRLMALVTVATLTLGSLTTAYGAEAQGTAPAVDPAAAVEEVKTEEVPVVEEVAVPVEEVAAPVAEVANVALNTAQRSFANSKGIIVGVYPVLVGNDALTSKIAALVNITYDADVSNNVIQESDWNSTLFTYNIEEVATHAKVEILKLDLRATTSKEAVHVVIATYYIDKATNKEVTQEVYEALLPAEVVEGTEEATETPAVGEAVAPVIVNLPLRSYAEALGYVVAWDNGSVTVSKDGKTALLKQGSTEYTNLAGEVVTLAAPTNVDGALVVPVEFFTQILGATVTVGADGTITIAETVAAPTEVAPTDVVAPVEEVVAPTEEVAPVETPAEVPAA